MANDVSTYLHDGMELPFEDWSNKLHSFNDLTSIIQTTHDAAFSSTVKAINRMQTMRNWLIGYYIVEFEQHGKDRAEYGTQLLKKLEEKVNRKGVTRNTFQSARNFYRMYPQIIENYDGRDVPLGTSGLVLRVTDFPHLSQLKGRTLITTDGTTILGSDDKSGIAEIMTVVEQLAGMPHGPVSVAFTPDEEIGRGTDDFRTDVFGAKYAFTLDGEAEGEVQYESFNAAGAEVSFRGNNVHPGSAKNVMVNAALVAMEFNEMLNSAQRPEYTENYQGFVHLTDMTGSVAEARLKYILRDHDRNMLAAMKAGMELAAQRLNEKYGAGTVELVIQDQYQNMAEILKDYPEVMEVARKACRSCGVSPISVPIRGATDGAILSFRGLPCPNLGTGGYAFHGPYEHLTVEGMDKMVEIVLEILRIFAE